MAGELAIREQKFVYGEYLDVNIYPVFRTPRQVRRSTKRKPTREAQQALNKKNRANDVNRVICSNFTNDDYYATLTYAGLPPTEEQVRRDVENFLKRYGRALAKKGKALKWVKTIEIGAKSGRIHIHLIITGGLSPKELQALWGRGYVDCKPLMFDVNGVMGLAGYFCKEQRNTAGDGHRRKSWSCSRNCTHPQPRTNDYRYSRKKAAEIAREGENCRVLEKLYPGYICAGEPEIFHNDDSGLYYIHMRFYRAGAKFDLRG